MRKYIFPYSGSGGKGDTWEATIEIELDDEETERLEASAREEQRWNLDEDDELEDLYERIQNEILEANKQMMIDDGRLDELREDEPDMEDDDLVDMELGCISIQFPEELQNLVQCDYCEEYFPENELVSWGDDLKICPDCFKEEFPPFDQAKNDAETDNAYQAMKKRYIGKKWDEYADKSICTDMDDDGYRYSIDVETDENNIITNVSRLQLERCRSIWMTGEDWRRIPIDASEYEEDGMADCLLEDNIVEDDDMDLDDEYDEDDEVEGAEKDE